MRVTWGVSAGRIAAAMAGAAAVAMAFSTLAHANSPVKLDGDWKAKILKARQTPAKATAPYQPVTFAELTGWAQDDHLAAFQTFMKSCGRLLGSARDRAEKASSNPAALLAACEEAARRAN